MAITLQDLEAFQRFAIERISHLSPEVPLDELAYEWQIAQERNDVNKAIEEGLSDIQAGRYRPAREVTDELAKKHGISAE